METNYPSDLITLEQLQRSLEGIAEHNAPGDEEVQQEVSRQLIRFPNGLNAVMCYAVQVDLYAYILHKQGKWPSLADDIKVQAQRIQYIAETSAPKDIRYIIAEISGWGQISSRLLVDQLDTALEIADYYKQYCEEWNLAALSGIQQAVFAHLHGEFDQIATILRAEGKSKEDIQQAMNELFEKTISKVIIELDHAVIRCNKDLFAPPASGVNS